MCVSFVDVVFYFPLFFFFFLWLIDSWRKEEGIEMEHRLFEAVQKMKSGVKLLKYIYKIAELENGKAKS